VYLSGAALTRRTPEELMQTKETVRALLDRLPDDCTLEDVLYHLYVLQAIDRGLADVEAGRTISHEQVAAEMRRKWVLGTAK
jgi:predicted transcriptional regulator